MNTGNRYVVVGGADIGDYSFIRSLLKDDDRFIYCDSGLRHMEELGRRPDLVVGDFDSHDVPELDCETIVLPREKDDTDTSYAVKQAIERECSELLLVGAAGNRQDHTLVNLYLLFLLDSHHIKAVLADDYSLMEVVSEEPVCIDDSCCYFSLLNMTGRAEGVTIRDAKYPLDNGSIGCEEQYATSNEVLPGKKACISVARGRLLLIRILKDTTGAGKRLQ